MEELPFILEQVLNGVVVSAYYLLIALGLSLIFSLGGIVNLAHGAFYALGAYFAVEIERYLGFGGALVLSPILVAMVGIALERTMFRRFYRSDPILGLLLTFGLAMVIEQAIRIVWGAAPLPFRIPSYIQGQLFVGDMIFPYYRLAMLAVAALAVTGTWLLLNKTSFGRVVKAGVQNPDMVAVLGISLAPIMTAVVALGIGLAGLAGAAEIAGLRGYLTLDLSPGFGYSGIVVAMLAQLHPLGVVAASVFVAAVFVGADAMSRTLAVPNYIAEVLVAVSLLCVLVSSFLVRYRIRRSPVNRRS